MYGSYLDPLFTEELPALVDWVHEQMQQFPTKNIVITGASGSLGFGLLAKYPEAEYSLIMLRKNEEHQHSHGTKVEGFFSLKEADTYVFLDDVIDSGETIKRVYEYFDNRTCVGVLLWGNRVSFKGAIGS